MAKVSYRLVLTGLVQRQAGVPCVLPPGGLKRNLGKVFAAEDGSSAAFGLKASNSEGAAESMRDRTLYAIEVLVLVAVYYYCGKFGLSLAFVNKSASAVWPPTGIALAALLLRGYRLWPGVFLGAFLVNFSVQPSWGTSLGISLGNTLEAVAGAWSVHRFAHGLKAFEQLKDFFKYVLWAAMLSTVISSSLGVTTLCLGGLAKWSDFLPIWMTWWLGDVVSNLVVAPLILIWLGRPATRLKPAEILEAAGVLVLVLLVGDMIFVGRHPFGAKDYPLEYLAIPPLLWAAFRFGERGAIGSAAIMSALAISGTCRGLGPFVRPDPNESLLLLQTFMGAITMMSLVLALIASERWRVEQLLRVQNAVSRVLGEAPSLKEATPGILQALCQKGEWDVAAIWRVNQSGSELFCVDLWHVPSMQGKEFIALTRKREFSAGIGLPGRVWKRGEPAWVPDVTRDDNFPRAAVAAGAGLKAAFCFPIKLGQEVLGVIECFSREAREPRESFLQMLSGLGNQLGQFIERKEAERASAHLATIVEFSEDAIISKTLEAIITSWNKGAERIFGYSALEMIGRPISALIPGDHVGEEDQIIERIKRGEAVSHYQTVRVRKDGQRIDVSLTISAIRDSSGQIVGASKIARDITEQKKTERALAEAQAELRRHAEDLEKRVQERTARLEETIQSLNTLCYSIAHDLRAPLRALGGFSNELFNDYSSILDDAGKDYLHRIRSAAARMDQLILDLLKLGRLNTAELPAETLNVGKVVRSALAPLESEIKAKGAEVRLKEPLLSVQGNPVMTEQVLQNLLGNALKFTPPDVHPKVDIWTEERDGMVRIFMQDNGIGIRPEHVKKLFQPFARLVNGADFQGTGIGLAIVRKGVERMGGQVGIESEPGKGSCFWIDLPMGQKPQEAPG